MANLERIIQARISQALPTNLQTTSNLERILEARRLGQESPDEEGFFERVNRFGETVFGDAPTTAEDPSVGEQFRADLAQFGAMGAAAFETGILGPIQAVAQIPGLFTDIELPFDKAANYLERMRHGILTQSEEAAIRSGVDPEAVADIHLFGEIVGYTAPVVASLKLGRMALGMQGGTDLTLARLFHLDTTAGIIFGSVLLPEDELKQRMVNTAREAAVFGIGGLMLNGLLFSVQGMRRAHQIRKGQAGTLQEKLDRMARGERVIFTEDDALPLTELLSEEGFLASSPEAHSLLEQFEFEQALVAGVRDWAESGLSRGFVREIGTDFHSVNRQLERFREQFPNLKFEVVSRTISDARQRVTQGRTVFHGTDVNFSGSPSIGDRPGLYLSETEQVATIRAGQKGRTFKGSINPSKTLNLDNPADDFVQLLERQASARLGEPANLAADQFDFVEALTRTRGDRVPGDIVGGITEREILRAARSLGYDSVRYTERVGVPGSTTWIALDESVVSFASAQGPITKVFDLHFGMKGMSNPQKAQLKREGRIAGQLIQKGDTFYQYVRLGKEGRLVVRTVDGKTTTLTPEGVTDLPAASEELPLPTAGQAMYENFREFVFGKMRQASGLSGEIPETDLIRFIREGQVPDLEGARVFESGGAITHQSELGRFPDGRKFELRQVQPGGVLTGNELAFTIVDANGNEAGFIVGEMLEDVFRITDMGATSNMPGALGTGEMRNIGRSIVEQLQAQGVQIRAITGMRASGTQPGQVAGVDVEELMRGGQGPEDFLQDFLREGKHSGGLLQPESPRSTSDAFDAWLRERELPIDAEDIEAVRQAFAQRMRSDIWALLPEEEAATMRRIHEEMFRLIEADELPFNVIAGTKGFHVERGPAGSAEVTLRDINTGARLHFANEEVAERALRRVIRSEKDPMSDYLTPGHHGGMALTTGFDPTDGIFTFETNIAPEEMLLDLPTFSFNNVRDYMIALEEVSKIPFFSQGFGEIDSGLLRMSNRMEPWTHEIANIWKGIKRNRRKTVAEFWTSVEGTDLSGAALNRAARNAGLSSKEVQAFTRARRMFDLWAEELGLPESRFISNYYSRIRGMYEEGISQSDMLRRLTDDPVFHKEFEFWAEMARSGDLPMVELDPEIVMHRYARGLAYKQEVAPLEQRFRQFLDTRIRDLPQAQQEQVLRRALPETKQNSFVLPGPVRDYAMEYINNIRGDVNSSLKSGRRMFARLMKGLGIQADPKIVDDLLGTYLSMQYGAAIALRTVLMNRNAVQNLWMMYTRVGAKHGGLSLERSMSLAGYQEALQAGAIRSTSAAVPMHDAIFEAWFAPGVAKGTGPASNAAAAVIRKAVRGGQITRKTAEKFLIPYGSGDQVNRAWAYHWQKLHTQDWLERFQAGSINWDTFVDEGLPFFSDVIKQNFRQRYDRLGTEAALQYIGKQAADEAHFIYGAASSPPWMQRPFGRLFGVFGQWPLWAKQLYINRMANATPKQVAQFWGRTAALTGMFANMSFQTGISMWNWLAPAALGYGGGPTVELAVQARNVIDSPMDQRAAALERLASEFGGLALPGQLFWKEIGLAADTGDPGHAALLLSLGRPADRSNFNFDIVLDPNSQGFITPPENRLPMIEGLPPLSR